MRCYYKSLLKKLPLEKEGVDFFEEVGNRIFDKHADALQQAVESYYANNFEKEPVEAIIDPLAADLAVSPYTLYFVLVACASQRMAEEYERRGYEACLFEDFLRDLACKVGECHRWYGEWGLTKFIYWYPLFFKLEIFALGRLQYQPYKRPNAKLPIDVGGHSIQPEDMVYFIHIPGLGPLTEELRMDSYRRAYAFFKEELKGRPFVLFCNSWMLYERNREFMKPTSNIVGFMNDFKIVRSFESPAQKYWWVFDRPYEGDASVLPRDTSLRRRLAEWLENGGVPGGGEGYFLFDGEHIIND